MLLRKMFRDMNQHKTQFISIFLMSFLGVFIYTGVGGEWFGLQKISNDYYEETNLADVWVYSKDISKEAVNSVKKVNGVKDAERRLSLKAKAGLKNNPDVNLYFIEENKISKCHLVKGEPFSNKKEGIWLDSLFAKKNNLKVGDTISFNTNGIPLKIKISGTVLNPEYVYAAGKNEIIPNHKNFGFGFISKKSFPTNMKLFYTDLLIKTDRKPDTKLENAIDKAMGSHYSVYLTRDNLVSYNTFQSEMKQHKATGSIFPVIFLSIAMLTILTTMTRIVNNQRTQIGVLKAMGFQRKKILYHYISYGFWLSLTGSLLGAILGPLTLPGLFYGPMQTTYTLPKWDMAIAPSFFIVALISVLICTFATYIACRNNLKDTPSETLHPKMPKVLKQRLLERTHLWLSLGFNVQWNLRDVFRNKIRSIMGIVGVLACTALLVCAFGMKYSLNDVIKWQYSDINQFTTKLALADDATTEQVQNILNKTNGEALMEGAVEIKANGKKKSGELLVTDHVTLIKATDINRKFMKLPNDSISISYKMASLLGLKKGDTISWHIYGDEKWVKSKIGAIYRSPISQGIQMSRQHYEKLGYHFTPTSIITSKEIHNIPDGASSKWTEKDLTHSYKIMMESMNMVVYVLIIAAILLAVIVLYNLGILSFTERLRELATLKVIGFQSKKIRYLLLTQNIWLTIIGILIGIPSGKLFIDIMMSTMGDSFDMMSIINTSTLIFSIGISLVVSVFVNLLFSGKIKRIDMVSSLKGVE